MATLTLSCSSASNSAPFKENASLRITYTALNGVLQITEIEGRRTDGYHSWNVNKTSLTVDVAGTSKSISLSHYIDFNSSWKNFGATDTTWSGLSGTSISITVTMPSADEAFGGAKFTGKVTMSWDTYTVSYEANGGSGAPISQTKTYGTALTLSSTKPTRTGYTFSKWNTKSDGSGTSYSAGGSYTSNSALTLYAIWTEHKLTVNYYSNGATSAFSDALNTVGSGKNVLVYSQNFLYDNDYSTYGLSNYSNSTGSVYMTRTGYTGTGNWGTSTSGGTLINENTGYATGQAIAKALGKDLSSGDASINLYAQWSENKLTVNYYSNYATYGTYQGEELSVSSSTNVKVHSQEFLYDNSYSSALSNVQNTSYLYLARMGYTPTGYWGTSTTGGNLVDEDDAYTGQELAVALGKDLSSGSVSVNVYPQWNINTYTFSYIANADTATGTIDSITVEWGETFVLPVNAFKREGYKFIGWNACRNTDNTWYVVGQGWITEDAILEGGYEKKEYQSQEEHVFGYSWVKGDEYTISDYTMYTLWEISGVVYIDNGTTFEPYLAYIDNGTDWELYLMYVDDSTDWNIIS